MASDDTEITLGAGKLLGLFFLLAAICGAFFATGYSLGKSSGREQALNDQPAQQVNAAADTAPASSANGDKPSAAVAAKPESQPSASDQTAGNDQPPLTFYKAVQQNDTSLQPTDKPQAAEAESPKGPKVVSEPIAKTSTHQATMKAAAPEVVSHSPPVTGPGTIVVQIAAVSREDDAVALAGALRKKNYNVFVVNNPITNDKFYHVQVGPFSTMAEAEAMKAKLVGEGYNPIIKR